jgi:hypothetical protein
MAMRDCVNAGWSETCGLEAGGTTEYWPLGGWRSRGGKGAGVKPALRAEVGAQQVGLGFTAADEAGAFAGDEDFGGTATAVVV